MEILIQRARMAMRNPARAAVVGVAALALLLTCNRPVAAQDSGREYAVKAAYLAKIGSFVGWPKSAFPTPDSPINLCVVGQDAVGAELDRAAGGQRAGDHPIVVQRLVTVARNSNCQILYIAGSGAQSVDQALDATRGANVFTVTDAMPTGATPSVLYFAIRDNRVRFVIDDQAAAQNGLSISSDLLKLALSVKPRS
jgi:hypothetical protein